MASFNETFDIPDVNNIHGVNGWQSVWDGGGGAAHGIEVFARYATNWSGETPVAAAYQAGGGKVPTTTTQEVRAVVTATEQGSSGRTIGIGIGGIYHATFASRRRGIRVVLDYRSNGERLLRLESDLSGANATFASLTLVAQGGVAQSGFHGGLLDAGALGQPQELRLRVSPDTGGLRLRAYVNSTDDDLPTLEHLLRTDYLLEDDGFGGFSYGQWMFELGQATARTLIVAEFFGTDYSSDRIVVEQRRDQPLLRDLIDATILEVEGGTNTDRSREAVKAKVLDALSAVHLMAGNRAYWLTRSEDMALSITDGRAVMPSRVSRVIGVHYTQDPYGESLWFRQEPHRDGTTGNVVINVGHNDATMRVTYLAHYQRPDSEDEPVPIPREHQELVVVGAARRLAERDPENRMYVESLLRRQAELEQLLLRELSANANQERKVVRTRPMSSWGPLRRVGWPSYL